MLIWKVYKKYQQKYFFFEKLKILSKKNRFQNNK